MVKRKLLCVGLLAMTVLMACAEQARFSTAARQPHPVALEAYGDSLTSGMFADTTLVPGPTMDRLADARRAFAATRGFPERLMSLSTPDRAWPAHFAAAARARNVQLEIVNRAFPGAGAAELEEQVRQGGIVRRPVMAVLFAGHNDVCGSTRDTADRLAESFRRSVVAALATWDRSHQDSTIYLLPVADIGRVYGTLWDYVFTRDAAGPHSCGETYQRTLPMCLALAQMPRADMLRFTQERTARLNLILLQLAAEAGRPGSTSTNRVVYLQALENLPLRPEYFALDCYHLSETGQRALADRVFEAMRN